MVFRNCRISSRKWKKNLAGIEYHLGCQKLFSNHETTLWSST